MSGKYIMTALIVVLFYSCKTGTTTKSDADTIKNTSAINKSDCPEGGICSWEVKEKMSFTIAKDDTGALYPNYSKGAGTIMEYTYHEKGPAGTADGDYTERIQFNVPDFSQKMMLKDAELAEVGLLFNKQCFCRGQAGFYPVTAGVLTLSKDAEGEVVVALDFSVEGTSQKMTTVMK